MSKKLDPISSATHQANANFDFISAFSHDAKTPLSVIKLFTDIMQSDLETIDTATQQKYLSIIKARTDDLNFLLGNAQDYYKVQQQKMEWHEEKHDLCQLIRKASFPCQVSCETKGIEFYIECNTENLKTTIDGKRFTQIIYNLLAYILSCTEKGSICVKLSASETSPHPNFTVTMGGSFNGTPTAELNAFMQSDYLSDNLKVRKPIETMLYVARHLIAHYQGQVNIENSSSKETRFQVKFPLLKYCKE